MTPEEMDRRLTKLEDTQQEVLQTLRGDKFSNDPEEQGLVGRVNLIFWTLWGAPNKPNGLVGIIKEGRVIWRTIAVGVVVTVVGGILLRYAL
jgi:hypothetical protein